MSPTRSEVHATIEDILKQINKPADVTDELHFDSTGLALDSLEMAEISAALEDAFGSDPISAGKMPVTVGEIVAFYDAE